MTPKRNFPWLDYLPDNKEEKLLEELFAVKLD